MPLELKGFIPRLYQQAIFESCKKFNTLVVLPTGLGKTAVSMLLALHRLNLFPQSKVLLFAPTKPLCNQHVQTFKDYTTITEKEITILTGQVPPKKREALWKEAKIIISTPQTIYNDIINQKLSLKEFSLIVFDEAHRAVGNYSYCWIAAQYNKVADFPRTLGLTASPGTDKEIISNVCKNLCIENIELRTEYDSDVAPYIQEIKIEWIKLLLPKEMSELQVLLKECFSQRINKLKDYGLISSPSRYFNKKLLLMLQLDISRRLSSGMRDARLWQGASVIAESIKLYHALELLETQGVQSLHTYLKSLIDSAETTKVKAVKNLAKDSLIRHIFLKAELTKVEHPKQIELKNILAREIKSDPNVKIIVFNHYRDHASCLEQELNKIEGIKAKLFIGQQKRLGLGLSQKEQLDILEKFKQGIYNCLVSTSIGEEGLDIPKVDLVVFYEPVPSAIRTIQRRGRTARLEKGRLVILITQGTRDEAYHWTSIRKEKSMHHLLNKIKSGIKFDNVLKEDPKAETKISDFSEKEKTISILIDSREKDSPITKELFSLDLKPKIQALPTADYIINDIAIELKTKDDFVNSILDGRLLSQLKDLSSYEKPLIIIQDEGDIFSSSRNIHPNAIYGMLATIAISFKIPIIQTKNSYETINLIKTIIAELQGPKKPFSLVGKKPLTTKKQQEFVISSLPLIGPTTAKALLKRFKTVKNIVNAQEDQLQTVENLGPKKAREIKKVLEEEYKE